VQLDLIKYKETDWKRHWERREKSWIIWEWNVCQPNGSAFSLHAHRQIIRNENITRRNQL